MVKLKKKSAANRKGVDKDIDKEVTKHLQDLVHKEEQPSENQEYAVVDLYLLIGGGMPNAPLRPNSIQFYLKGKGLWCTKRLDETSLALLAPILNCATILVRYNTHTGEVSWIGAYQSKGR